MITALVTLVTLLSQSTQGNPLTQSQGSPIKFELDIRNANDELVNALRKRDTIIEVGTDVHQVLSTFDFTLADQAVEAVVDTGSFSTWLASKNSTNSLVQQLCSSGSCIETTSEVDVSDDDYSIFYMGEFGASGKWATAPLSLNGISSTPMKFGLADEVTGSPSGYAWSGFGYSSIYVSQNTQMLDILKNGGIIDQRSLALEYESINSWSSSVMGRGVLYLGGYDGDKVDNITYVDFASSLSAAVEYQSVTNNTGSTLELGDNKLVLIDSGSTNFMLKQEYKDFLFGSVKNDATYPTFFKCSDYEDFTIKLEVVNKTIEVPLLDLSWNNYRDSYDLCQLMVSELYDSDPYEIILGQYFIKNFVTIIDVDNAKVGIAPNADNVTMN